MPRRIRRIKPLYFIIIIAAIIAAESAWLFFNSDQSFFKKKTIEQYAQEVLRACRQANYRPTCYDEEIPKLMDYISMEDAFKVTRIVQDNDSSYAYCHVLAHELSAREVQKDPLNWKDVVTRCPSGMCSNGCLHGGFQEKFRAESFTPEQIEELKPDLYSLCERRDSWNPTGMEQASCYHALGHLTMYVTGADIFKSLEVCDETALKKDGRDFRQLCYDGAFMQIFQPLEPEDFDLVEGKEVKKEELEKFCSQFSGHEKASCRSEGWPLFRDELQKPAELVKYCSKSDPSELGRCYSAIIYVMAAQFGLDSDKIYEYCSGLPNPVSGQCFANSASRMIETDYRNINKAVTLCTRAAEFDRNNQCLNEMLVYSDYNFHRDSPEFAEICQALPPGWKEKCLSGNKL